MNIKRRSNTTVLTNDFKTYKINWLRNHKLTEKINKGELFIIDIETQKEQKSFTIFSKEYYSAIKDWYNNFESLYFDRYPKIEVDKKDIDYLRSKYQTSTQLIKEIKKKINIDNDLLNWFAYYIRNIYLQPVFYYDATKLYPDTLPEIEKTIKRYDYISGKCNIVQSKFNSLSYQDIKEIINKLISDETETEKLLKKIFLYVELLIYDLPNNWFIYNQSPVFISFIDTIRELKQYYDFNMGNKGLPKLNKCFIDVKKLKNNFELPVFENKTIYQSKESKPLDSNTLDLLNEIGITNILKNKYSQLSNSENKLHQCLNAITDSSTTYYFRIGFLIETGVYQKISTLIKKEQFVINPNKIADKLKPIFDYKKTSIEPIIRAYENNETESKNYPLKTKERQQIENILNDIGIK